MKDILIRLKKVNKCMLKISCLSIYKYILGQQYHWEKLSNLKKHKK